MVILPSSHAPISRKWICEIGKGKDRSLESCEQPGRRDLIGRESLLSVSSETANKILNYCEVKGFSSVADRQQINAQIKFFRKRSNYEGLYKLFQKLEKSNTFELTHEDYSLWVESGIQLVSRSRTDVTDRAQVEELINKVYRLNVITDEEVFKAVDRLNGFDYNRETCQRVRPCAGKKPNVYMPTNQDLFEELLGVSQQKERGLRGAYHSSVPYSFMSKLTDSNKACMRAFLVRCLERQQDTFPELLKEAYNMSSISGAEYIKWLSDFQKLQVRVQKVLNGTDGAN